MSEPNVATFNPTDWHIYRKTRTIRAKLMTEDFQVETLEGTMQGRAGDFLCEGSRGERWPIRREIFEATYEIVMEAKEGSDEQG